VKRSSIRFRLTTWYFAVLALGLAAFGVAAWLAMRASLHNAVDDSLKDRVQGVKRFMDEQISALSIVEIRDEFREHSVLGPGGDLFQVSDADGNWLYRSVPLEENRLAARRPADLGTSGVYEAVTLQGAPLRILSESITVHGRPYTVQVATPMHEIEKALEHLRWMLLFSMPLLLIAATLGGYWISRRALAPVDTVTEAARSISIENLTERLQVPRTGDELERLSRTFNEMLARLQHSVERMTQFTADASHELRGPTALIRTTAELALRRERSGGEYKEALGQVLTESERMSHLVDSLLLLARSDSGTDGSRAARFDLTASVNEACEEGRTLAISRGVAFRCEIPSSPLELSGDPQSLRRMFFILIDNAVKYTLPGGEVSVELREENGFAVGVVRDTGIGIAEHDLSRIFDRFWRADKVRSREAGGAGLGLSIARWIAERHGGQIQVESKLGEGSIFRLVLPSRDEHSH
jgi:heavy metal sensor kinase